MSWNEEKILIEVNDENGETITTVEMKKSHYAMVVVEAEKNGITVEEQFIKMLSDYIGYIENEENQD